MNQALPLSARIIPYALQRPQDHARLAREAARCRRSPSAARACPIGGRSGSRSHPGSGGRDRCNGRRVSSAVKRIAWSIRPRLTSLVAHQPRQDRQAGRVGRGPAARAQPVRAQVPDRARARAPALAAVDRLGVVQLVEPAAVAVDDQRRAGRRRPRSGRCPGSDTGPGRTRRCTGSAPACLGPGRLPTVVYGIEKSANRSSSGPMPRPAGPSLPRRRAGRRPAGSRGCSAGTPGSRSRPRDRQC